MPSPNLKYFTWTHSIAPDHAVNFSVDNHFILDYIRLYITIAIPKDKGDRNYQRKVLQTHFELCKMIRGASSNFFGQILYDVVTNFADKETAAKIECPFKVGMYSFISIIVEDKFIPKFLLSSDLQLYVILKAVGKVAEEEKTAELLNLKIYARVCKKCK